MRRTNDTGQLHHCVGFAAALSIGALPAGAAPAGLSVGAVTGRGAEVSLGAGDP